MRCARGHAPRSRPSPSCASASVPVAAQRAARAQRHAKGPWRRAHVDIAFPVANIGANLPTLAATVSGNLYDLGEVTGLRLESLQVPAAYRAQFDMPRVGIAGTRSADRRGERCAGRHHHQAERGAVRGGNRRAGRRAVRRGRRLHQGRRGLRRPRARPAGAARQGRDGRRARAPAAHRQARDGGLQHHRRDRRDEAPRRPGRARRRLLRDGQPELVRPLRHPDLRRTHRWHCTGTATATARCRGTRCWASPSRPTRRCGGWRRGPHARARAAGQVLAARRAK
jgi:hypothetical protein